MNVFFYFGGKKIGKWLSELPDLPSGKETAKKWYFVTKIVMTYCEKNCSSDREKLLKFEAEG